MLVAGLAADPELLAQVGDRELPATRQRDEANELFHMGYFGPGHRALCVTHQPGLSVTYHPGSYLLAWPYRARTGEGTVFPFAIGRLDRAQLEKPGTVLEAFVVE